MSMRFGFYCASACTLALRPKLDVRLAVLLTTVGTGSVAMISLRVANCELLSTAATAHRDSRVTREGFVIGHGLLLGALFITPGIYARIEAKSCSLLNTPPCHGINNSEVAGRCPRSRFLSISSMTSARARNCAEPVSAASRSTGSQSWRNSLCVIWPPT